MCVAFDGQLKTTVFIPKIVHDVNFQQQKQRTEKSGASIIFTFSIVFFSTSSFFYCKNNKNISISLSIQIRIRMFAILPKSTTHTTKRNVIL